MIDAEKLVIRWATGRFDPTRVASEKPPSFTKLICVTRDGGPGRFVMDHPRLTVECFDATRQDARALAFEVANALLFELPGTVGEGGTVTEVSIGSGPFWLPWENPNVRRFGIAAQLTIR